MKILVMCLTLIAPLLSQAAQIGRCNELDKISYFTGYSKTFYNGDVTVALVDTDGEPVWGSSHVLFIIPGKDYGTQCFALSHAIDSGYPLGFYNVEFKSMQSSYHPQRGLLLEIPYELFIDGVNTTRSIAKVRINLLRNTVRLER